MPFAQPPPVDGDPEEVGGDEGAAEETPDGAAEDPMTDEAPAGADGAELPVTVCMVVTVRMPPEGLGCAEAAGAELLPEAAELACEGAGPPPPTGAPS